MVPENTITLFSDDFLEKMEIERGLDTTKVLELMAAELSELKSIRLRKKRGRVMRNYKSAFDKVHEVTM